MHQTEIYVRDLNAPQKFYKRSIKLNGPRRQRMQLLSLQCKYDVNLIFISK